jgi:hypothetical protein
MCALCDLVGMVIAAVPTVGSPLVVFRVPTAQPPYPPRFMRLLRVPFHIHVRLLCMLLL